MTFERAARVHNAVMSRVGKVGFSIAAVAVIILAVVVWRLLPLWTGPSLPQGATRLHIATQDPNFSMGCATALLAPVRVTTSGKDLILVTVESANPVPVVWPAGFAAWRIDDDRSWQIPGARSSAATATCSTASVVAMLGTVPSASVRSGSCPLRARTDGGAWGAI